VPHARRDAPIHALGVDYTYVLDVQFGCAFKLHNQNASVIDLLLLFQFHLPNYTARNALIWSASAAAAAHIVVYYW
jgi:hypothetical protein